MSETVVHVETVEQWKSVLDVWFKKGFAWSYGPNVYNNRYFDHGERFLRLSGTKILRGERFITVQPIEYADFMAQQKDDKKVKTYYVTKRQLDLIEELNSRKFPIDSLALNSDCYFKPLTINLTAEEAKAILRYIGGDETIKFKVKGQLYRLWRADTYGDRVYMRINDYGTPTWGSIAETAFTAPLEEIKKWKTPAWEIEKVD